MSMSVNSVVENVKMGGMPALSVVNDSVSLNVTDSVSISSATSGTREYKPHYEFGKAVHSCGAFCGMTVRENLSMQDACKLRDQMRISVFGIPQKTPDMFKDVKPFTNIPANYSYGAVDMNHTCGSAKLPIDWTLSDVSTEKEAKAFCKTHHIAYKPE